LLSRMGEGSCPLFDSLYEVSRAEFHVEVTPVERPDRGRIRRIYPPNCLVLEAKCRAPVTETKSPVSRNNACPPPARFHPFCCLSFSRVRFSFPFFTRESSKSSHFRLVTGYYRPCAINRYKTTPPFFQNFITRNIVRPRFADDAAGKRLATVLNIVATRNGQRFRK